MDSRSGHFLSLPKVVPGMRESLPISARLSGTRSYATGTYCSPAPCLGNLAPPDPAPPRTEGSLRAEGNQARWASRTFGGTAGPGTSSPTSPALERIEAKLSLKYFLKDLPGLNGLALEHACQKVRSPRVGRDFCTSPESPSDRRWSTASMGFWVYLWSIPCRFGRTASEAETPGAQLAEES